MRNRNIIQNTGLLALVLLGSALAAPISLSLTGTDKLVSVDSRATSILSGGSFNAHVGDPALPGVPTLFWCADIENYISPGSPSAQYDANIILVSNTTAQAGSVRKGGDTAWEDGLSFSAQQRYNGAAFLVEKIIAGSSGYSNDDLQRAIWRLTDLAVGSETDASYGNAAYTAATSFITTGGATANTWATVSGVATANGGLSALDTRQTFLVEIAPVPEPGTYALIGAGLLLLASLRRRRAN